MLSMLRPVCTIGMGAGITPYQGKFHFSVIKQHEVEQIEHVYKKYRGG